MNKDHTFVILAYKESPYLEDCIRSLISQNEKSHIIISTSTPSDFIEKLSKKYNLPVRINTESSGIAADWNFAYGISDTKYVTLAHQDDIYSEDYLKKCSIKAQKHPNNLIIFTGYKELYGSKVKAINTLLIIKRILLFPFLFTSNLENRSLKKAILLFGSPIPCPGVMYNKENLGNFKFDVSFTIDMDWNAWIELAHKPGGFVYERKKLFFHRIHDEAETSKGIIDNRRKNEDIIIFNKLWPYNIAKIIAQLYSLSYKSNKLP